MSSLYKAERVAFWEPPDSDGSPDFQTVGECQDYVDAVTESDMWQRLADTWRELGLRNPSKTDNLMVVLDGRGRKYAEGKSSDVALVCADIRTADTTRMMPSTSLSVAARTKPTSNPPTTAPTTDPTPIGATVALRSRRSENEPRLACLSTPTATVGRLMSRLAVPAVLMPAPNTNTSVGMISSPPATPNKLLTIPIASPKSTATTIRNGRESGSKAGTSCGKNASTIRAEPTTTSSTSMNRSSVRSEMRCTSATPTNAADTAPAIMATTTGSRAMRGARSNVPPRISRAPRTVIRLMARLRATARRAAYPNTPANTGRRNSAPPNPMRPPRRPMGVP